MSVALNIDASRIAFTAAEGRQVADLDLVIYAAHLLGSAIVRLK